MIAKSPADRYPSMAEVIKALDGVRGQNDERPIANPTPLSRLKSWSSGVFASLVRSGRTLEMSRDSSPEDANMDENQATLAGP
jgi:hypothetical protein